MKEPIILSGKVVHGKALGRTVGMPTANLCIEDGTIPEDGVYATRISVQGKTYTSVTNIGRRPTVDDESYITVETFIIDFNEDIYGQFVELEVYKFLRPIQKFSSLEEVQKQVNKDIEEAKTYFLLC
jgi:riboflavin kinase/FMN adenylyltransferase